MKDLDKQKEFIKLRAKGKSFKEISEKLGVSKRTLINCSKDLSYEIANAHAIELEALQDEF